MPPTRESWPRRLLQIVPYTDASLLQAKLIKGSTLKIYQGASHGMCTVNKAQVNDDLLAFIRG